MKQLKIFFLFAICSIISTAIKAQEFEFKINSPTAVSGSYYLYKSKFGPQDTVGIHNREIILSTPLNPCGGITNNISNKIVFLDRGPCSAPNENDGTFFSKVRYAQNANAAAVIICNNENPEVNPTMPEGEIDNITIKSFLMKKPDCDKIKLTLLNEPIYAHINQILCVPADTSSNIIWGNKQGEGDFAYGLNGWTFTKYNEDSLKWWPSGKINSNITFNSSSQCNGIALIYNSISSECASCKNALISPIINVKEYSKFGLKVEFQHLSLNALGNGSGQFFMYVSKDGGVSYPDSFEIQGYGIQKVDLLDYRNIDIIRIKFEGGKLGYGIYWWAFDDVIVKSIPESSCDINLYVSSQWDINNFYENNPGCTSIHNLTIDNSGTDTFNFKRLNQINSITGTLKFVKNWNVTFKTDILPNLESIGGDFVLENNYKLYNFNGFDKLKKIKGNLIFQTNDKIAFPQLNKLDSLFGSYSIEENIDVNNIGFANNLTYIGGKYTFYKNTLFEDSILNNAAKSINGNISISFNTNLKTIEGFNCYNSLDDIYIRSNNDLTSIDGFDSIYGHSSNIDILDNKNLIDINMLNNISYIYNLDISYNTSLFNITGFKNCDTINNCNIVKNNSITKISNSFHQTRHVEDMIINNISKFENSFSYLNSVDYFSITDCPKLEQLLNFDSLKTVNKLTVSNCPNLIEIVCMSNLVKGDISINKNNSLHIISSFNNLKKSSIFIIENPSLIKIDGFQKLDSANLNIINNTTLTSLPNLNNLRYASITIQNNSSLENINGFNNLESIGNGSINIVSNPNLKSIPEFNKLVGNTLSESTWSQIDIQIELNPSLKYINAFHKLIKCDGIIIKDNANLDSLSICKNLTYIKNALFLMNNPNLVYVNGFENVDTIISGFSIINNGIKNVSFLQSLKYTEGGFWIRNNSNLDNLEHLINLRRIGTINNKKSISVLSNPKLTSLKGLDNINPSSIEEITIVDNYLLDYCHIKSICLFLDDHSIDATIEGNELNCGSIARVKDACSKITSINDDTMGDVLIYPNPASTELNIVLNESTEISIRDLFGNTHIKQVVNFKNNIIDTSLLPKGVYNIYIKNKVHRIVKI